MISNQRNYYSIRILAVAFLALLLMISTFLFVGGFIIPEKLKTEVSQSCIHHLKDKSYQIKQTLLENANNSKLWIENRESTFFDSKWFAISYYEHDGKEWVLKDFKMNDVVLDIYKIAQSEYIKVDQGLSAPSSHSQQINLQESKIADMPVLVLDIPNNITSFTSQHLIRITLFADQFTSTLNSDEKCKLSLMDTKGNFLIQDQNIDQLSFLRNLQNNSKASAAAEVFVSEFENRDVFNYKVLKNLYILGFAKPSANIFRYSFLQISIFNFLVIAIIIMLTLHILWIKFQVRLSAVNGNIRKISEKNYILQFNLSREDELTPLDEEVSRLADEMRKKK